VKKLTWCCSFGSYEDVNATENDLLNPIKFLYTYLDKNQGWTMSTNYSWEIEDWISSEISLLRTKSLYVNIFSLKMVKMV
jgi:hypothetical protein